MVSVVPKVLTVEELIPKLVSGVSCARTAIGQPSPINPAPKSAQPTCRGHPIVDLPDKRCAVERPDDPPCKTNETDLLSLGCPVAVGGCTGVGAILVP
jgi:hypothetical protein